MMSDATELRAAELRARAEYIERERIFGRHLRSLATLSYSALADSMVGVEERLRDLRKFKARWMRAIKSLEKM
jgi:hypothetical protein